MKEIADATYDPYASLRLHEAKNLLFRYEPQHELQSQVTVSTNYGHSVEAAERARQVLATCLQGMSLMRALRMCCQFAARLLG
jgi:hypothetical protein